jgi:hypothetical protein
LRNRSALEEPFGREPDRLQDGVATGQGILGVLAGRDVEKDPLPHHRVPVGVAQQLRLIAHPHHASVATEEAVFGREGLAGLVRPLRELEDSVAVVRVQMVDPELRVPQPGARREAEQPLVLRADVERGAHLVDRVLVDHDRELFDQGPVVGLGLLEELLCDLALRDVEHHALVQGVAVVVAPDGDRLVADPELTAVACAHPILRTEGPPAPPGRRPFGFDTLQVVPVYEHGPQLWISELVRRIAEHLLDLGADERRGRIVTAVGGVPRVRHGGHAFHQRAIARLRLGKILLGALALGDVVHDSLRQRRTALAVAFDRDRLLVDPDDRAVLADVAVLDRERFAGAVRQVRRRQDEVAILVVHPTDPQGGVVRPFLRREPQDLLDLRAHVRRGHRARGSRV